MPQGHYGWVIEKGQVTDGRAMAYGHAFVMLAAASCVQAGISEAAATIDEIWEFMEAHFWDAAGRAYADELDCRLEVLDPYRGQNANMHSCKALLAAYQATGQQRYLERAELLAQRFAVELAAANDGVIWEHYDANWQVDMQYYIDKPDDLFKPWGFQPGHQVEWTKLLLTLNQESPNPLWMQHARELYEAAMSRGWDEEFGGLVWQPHPRRCRYRQAEIATGQDGLSHNGGLLGCPDPAIADILDGCYVSVAQRAHLRSALAPSNATRSRRSC